MKRYIYVFAFLYPFLLTFLSYLEKKIPVGMFGIFILLFLPFVLYSILNIRDTLGYFKNIWFYVIVVFYAFISGLWALDFKSWLVDIIWISIVLFISFTIFKLEIIQKFWKYLSLGIIALSYLLYSGVFHYFFNYVERYRFGYYRGDIALNPNSFGLWLVVALVYFSYKVYSEFKINNGVTKEKVLYFILLLSSVYFLFLTGSRGALFPLLFSILLIFLIKNKKVFIYLICVVAILVSSLFFIQPKDNTIINRYKEGFSGDLNGRGTIWLEALKVATTSPKHLILGYGIGSAEIALGTKKDKLYYHESKKTEVVKISSHNNYLHWLLQGGIIGLTLFLFSLFYVLKEFLFQKENTILRMFLSGLWITLIVMGMSNTISNNSIYLLVTSMIMAYYVFLKEKSECEINVGKK